MNKALLKLTKLSFFAILIFSIFSSCKKENKMEIEENNSNYNCEFVQNDDDMDGLIDDNERAIIDNCYDNRYFTKSEIENNLIGEWELVGHGEGWVPTISQPCGYLTFSEEELTLEFENANIGVMSTHSWEINSAPSGIFTLQINPAPGGDFLNIFIFCEEYMYGDFTPLDGNMYLYQKVN